MPKKSALESKDIPKKVKYFRDPIHGFIEVDPKARYVIDIHSVEIYVLPRFNMYLQVYAHHTRRAFDLMLNSIFPKEEFERLGYPKPSKKEIDNLINVDDTWVLEKIRAIEKAKGNSLRSFLATQFLTRDPIKWVCECLAFTDVREPSKRVLPAYTTLSNLDAEIARKEMVNPLNVPIEEIWVDIPLEDLPFGNRYRPFSYRGEKEEKGIIRVRASPKEEPIDIAEFPSSLASFLARNMAQMVKIYTTRKYGIKLRDNLRKRYSDFKEIVWVPFY